VFLLALSSVSPAYAAAPLNDNFADAASIDLLPFSATVDITEATTEAEPQSCWFMDRTVWYSITPAQTMVLRANTAGSAFGGNNVNIYRSTGAGINSLNFLGCGSFGNTVTFLAEAGQTYYLQAGPIFGETGNLQINMEQFVPPPPTAGICFGPSDPSIFDTMQFNDCSSEPGGVGFQSFTWDFGDGTTLATPNCCVNHKYAVDGDYTVQHGVTTYDGRTASNSLVVQVRTKDIAITTFSVPQTARVNQTKTINVNIQNKRYSDYVQVFLYKGLPGGGEQQIGFLTIYVPAKAKQATTFKFSYTFTSDDATVGKVTFRAVANIATGRDALPADNTSIATTSVSK
jgi:hypothetical protein